MDDDLATILAAIQETGVYVGPLTDDWVTPDEVAQVEANIQEIRDGLGPGESGVYVVLVDPGDGPPYNKGDDLLVRIHQAFEAQSGKQAAEGLYIGVNTALPLTDGTAPYQPHSSREQFDLAFQQWGRPAGEADALRGSDYYLSYGADDGSGEPFPLGEGLVGLTGHLADGTFSEAASAGRDGLSTGLDSSTPDDGDGGAPVGVVSVVLALCLAVVAVVLARRRLRSTGSGRRPATFTLPDSVLDRVREAEDAQLVRRARADVLALGEAIDETEMGTGAGAAWQAALDHYEAASRLLPAEPDETVDPLDATGAVVLAKRGSAALAAARKGTPFVPTTPCFLNPLHGAGTKGRRLEHGTFSVDAPVCPRCRRDLGAGRRPDILDVLHRGKPQHYFETDREPWASTGFGALDHDLVRRLHGGRR